MGPAHFSGGIFMGRYIARRFLWTLLVLLVLSFVTFALTRAVPGGPFDREKSLPPEILKNLEARYHLDEPFGKQYLRYLNDVLIPRITARQPTPILEEISVQTSNSGTGITSVG
jgi:ABC-type dipeptide/oligopeptide/nickel transport system permease component